MAEEVEQVELTEEKVELLKKAYERPVAGLILNAIAGFQKSMEAQEEEEEPEEQALEAEV